MLVVLYFYDHIDWSDEKIEESRGKIFKYLKERNIEYGEIPLDFDSIIIDIEKGDFLEFCSFLTEKLGVSPNCIHVPYQILCVNGAGDFEVIDKPPDGMIIDDFVKYLWHKQAKFPRIE